MKTIILIEDDLDTQILYGECLENENFKVVCCDTAQDALDCINSDGLPDLLIMDLNIPGMSPEEFLTKVRRIENGTNVPVIVISGDSEINEKTKKLGAQDCLKKPFGIDPFIEIVKNWI